MDIFVDIYISAYHCTFFFSNHVISVYYALTSVYHKGLVITIVLSHSEKFCYRFKKRYYLLGRVRPNDQYGLYVSNSCRGVALRLVSLIFRPISWEMFRNKVKRLGYFAYESFVRTVNRRRTASVHNIANSEQYASPKVRTVIVLILTVNV